MLPAGFDPQDDPGLAGFAALLARWNDKINLVGRQDIERLWPRHIEDSLFLYRCLPQPDVSSWVLDVGSGGGLPGMVLALADSVHRHNSSAANSTVASAPQDNERQRRKFVLLDRSERKVRFLTQVVAQLKLNNVIPLQGDFTRPLAEASSSVSDVAVLPKRFAVICARAVAPPVQLWDNLQHLLADNGELLVACGPQTKQQLPPGVRVEWFANQASEGRGVVRLGGHE